MRTKGFLFLWVLLYALFSGRSAAAETVSLPISIDPPLLRSMLVKAAYTDPNRTAVLVDEANGCKRIVLSEPSFVIERDRLLFETRVSIRAGFSMAGFCILPLRWEGYVSLTQVPVLNDQWVLSLKTVDSRVYDTRHAPARVLGAVWNLIESYVIEYLGQVRFNLDPPVEDLRTFTADLFPPSGQERAKRMMESFRPGKVETGPETIRIGILADIEEEAGKQAPEGWDSLTQQEADEFISVWKSWDAYLVLVVTSLPRDQLSAQEKDLLLDVLLETRHRFEEELLDPHETGDFVRKQFVEAWGRLSPIFRKRLSNDPARPLLEYLAFFTASDALVTLDRLGPTLGIEISRQGLIHLARLISGQEMTDLPYNFLVDKDLRAILGLGDPLPFTDPTVDEDSIDIDPDVGRPEQEGWIHAVKAFLAATAWAQADVRETLRERITPWVVPKGDLMPFLERVRALLSDSSGNALAKTGIGKEQIEFFTFLVLATAWQESCFRQFTVKGGKVTFLRSWNGTSVGIMQVNERVWRGIYDEKHLRWDILYNAAAGCEILGIYLQKYALPKIAELSSEKRPDPQTLARIVYAMYYGGPDQFQKVRDRLARGRPNSMDKLFLEKHQWVRGNQWDKIEVCL
jgi:hypothetical protein